MRNRFRNILRLATVGLVLAIAAFVVPDSALKSTDAVLVKVHRASGVDLSPDVVWILAVGSDARPGQDMTRSRGDALQLVGMNTKTGAAAAIGVPRDSWVSIPGHGNEKINSALYYGGPQ
jgi:anionic cell wall polymer biosynthesis LytR-Cps2A-Psr (LCP) family protein